MLTSDRQQSISGEAALLHMRAGSLSQFHWHFTYQAWPTRRLFHWFRHCLIEARFIGQSELPIGLM
jgi:hypothetical protein